MTRNVASALMLVGGAVLLCLATLDWLAYTRFVTALLSL